MVYLAVGFGQQLYQHETEDESGIGSEQRSQAAGWARSRETKQDAADEVFDGLTRFEKVGLTKYIEEFKWLQVAFSDSLLSGGGQQVGHHQELINGRLTTSDNIRWMI